MFEIKLADTDVTSGSVPVTWCLDEELLNHLATSKIIDPQVVLVVSPKGDQYNERHEYRTVVPLKDLMGYVEFRVPGSNQIWAFISFQGRRKAKSIYLEKSRIGYDKTILNFDGTDWCRAYSYVETGSEPISVDVPSNIFAKEPADWEKEWVNWLTHSTYIDQCEFREKRILAYTLQPFVFLANMLARFVCLLFLMSIGNRDFKSGLNVFLHPMANEIGDMPDPFSAGTIFVRQIEYPDYGSSFPQRLVFLIKKYCLLPLMPLISVPIIILFCIKPIIALTLIGIVIAMGLMLFFFNQMIEGTLYDWVSGLFEDRTKFWYLDKSEMDYLVCSPNKKEFTPSSLPAEKKSIRLRFQTLKSKVCRPFAMR